MRAGVPFNRRSSSPSGNNPTSRPPSRAQSRRGRFPCPSHLCQADIHSQERNGDALASLKSACHSCAIEDKASAPLSSSTTNLLTSTPRRWTKNGGRKIRGLFLSHIFCPLGVQRAKVAPDVFAVSARVFIRAGPRQTVISSGQINEAYPIKKKRQKVIRRISDFWRNSHDDVFLEIASGEVESERSQS